MKSLVSKFDAIAEHLKKQIRYTEEDIEKANNTLQLIKSDEQTYNNAWLQLAGLLAMNNFLHNLDSLIKKGKLKSAENYIRFTCHQIEQFTDKALLDDDKIRSTGNTALDSKILIHDVFAYYLLDIIERD